MEELRRLHPALLLVLLVALPSLGLARAAWGQTSTTDAPASGAPATPAQPAAPAPPTAGAPVPTERPFVPPTPPPPSQTRIPGAFQEPFLTPPSAVYELHPTFTLSEEYTDNFTVSERRGTENFRTSLGAGVTLLINRPLTRGIVIANVRGSVDSATGGDEVRIFPTLTASVQHTFSPRLSLTVTDTFVRSDEPTQGDADGLRRERATFLTNTFGASVDWLLDLVATQSYYRNTLFFGARDSVGHILGFNASTPLGPLMSLRGGYEFTRRETKQGAGAFNSGESTTGEPTATGTSTSDDDTVTVGHRVLGSLSRRVGQWASVGVSGTYSWLTTERGGRDDEEETRIWNVSLFTAYGTPAGFSISGSLGYGMIDRDRVDKPLGSVTSSTTASYRWGFSVATLSLRQDFRQTADEGEDFGTVITRSLTGTFSHQLTPFINANLRASYSRNEPTGSGNDAGGQASSIFTGGATLTWQIVRWLRMNLEYTHIQRSRDNDRSLSAGGDQGRSTGREGESTENRGTVSLTATF